MVVSARYPQRGVAELLPSRVLPLGGPQSGHHGGQRPGRAVRAPRRARDRATPTGEEDREPPGRPVRQILLFPMFQGPLEVEIPEAEAHTAGRVHAGTVARQQPTARPLGMEGLPSRWCSVGLLGAAANRSIATGRPVTIEELGVTLRQDRKELTMRDSSGGAQGRPKGDPWMRWSPPAQGRRYTHHRRVRVSDAGPEGALRLDSLPGTCRCGHRRLGRRRPEPDEIWVVRRTTVQVAGGGRWPHWGRRRPDYVVRGTGPAWAERRTDLEANGVPSSKPSPCGYLSTPRDARCGSGRSSTMFTEKRRAVGGRRAGYRSPQA